MKRIILKSDNTSVRLSGSVIRFLTPVSREIEITDEEYVEYEGQLLWLIREGVVDVIDVKQDEKERQGEQEKVKKGKKGAK